MGILVNSAAIALGCLLGSKIKSLGPIALTLHNDNSQLLIKSFVDMPLAIVAGATYGAFTALSALPVAFLQLVIAFAAYFMADLAALCLRVLDFILLWV